MLQWPLLGPAPRHALSRTLSSLSRRNYGQSRSTFATRPASTDDSSFTEAPPRPKFRSLNTLSLAAFALSFYTLGVFFPPKPWALLYPPPAPAPLPASSPEGEAYTDQLESKLQLLPYLRELRKSQSNLEWYECRPHVSLPEERRVNNLTAGALRGPGKLAIPALWRARRDEKESIALVHLGRGLCGHDGIIHGGLLATILDEGMGRTAILNLPDKVGVTAKLSVRYKAPTRADQFIVLKTAITEAEGRRVIVTGRIEDLKGNLLVESEGTFVQPKYSKLLNAAALKKHLGEPPPVQLGDGDLGKDAPPT